MFLTRTRSLPWKLKIWLLPHTWLIGLLRLSVSLGMLLLVRVRVTLHFIGWLSLITSRFLRFLFNSKVSVKSNNKCQIEVINAPHHLENYTKMQGVKSSTREAKWTIWRGHLNRIAWPEVVSCVRDRIWNLGLLTLMFIDIYNMFLMLLIDLIEASKLI